VRQIISYIRVSTGKQGRSGLGIDAQRDAIARFAAAEGREVLAEFVEVETGKGADALDRRPMLAEALTKARKIKAPGREALPTISRRAVHLRPDGQPLRKRSGR
jgi:DNA invertase Pin-like site-specific DNA recombinase